MKKAKPALARLSIPPRLRGGCLTKEAFNVPDSPEGTTFLNWWEEAPSGDRDTVMKLAIDHNITVLEAQKKQEAVVEEAE